MSPSFVGPPFVGSWRLVSQHSLYADGSVVPSRGENAEGIIMYDAAGNMAVQLMRTDARAPDFTDLAALETAMQGYLAYYGRYEVEEPQDATRGVVRHFVTGASYFGYRNTVQVRHYEFAGDTLTLKAEAAFDNSTRLLVWRRVG
jgi:hypothetical protein